MPYGCAQYIIILTIHRIVKQSTTNLQQHVPWWHMIMVIALIYLRLNGQKSIHLIKCRTWLNSFTQWWYFQQKSVRSTKLYNFYSIVESTWRFNPTIDHCRPVPLVCNLICSDCFYLVQCKCINHLLHISNICMRNSK